LIDELLASARCSLDIRLRRYSPTCRRGASDAPLASLVDLAERAVAHGRDHDGHGEVERLAPKRPPIGAHIDLVHDVAVGRQVRQVALEGEIGDVRQRAAGAVPRIAVAADLRLDVNIFWTFGVPIGAVAGRLEEAGSRARALGARIAQAFCRR